MIVKVTNFKEWLAETQKRARKEAFERMKQYIEKAKERAENDDSRETSTDSQ